MIELQTSVKQDDTTRTRTPKPGYLNLSIILPPPSAFDVNQSQRSIASLSVRGPESGWKSFLQ
jgi:hypothetical protein